MDTGDWSSGETRNESSPRGRPACGQQGLPVYRSVLPASPPDSVSFFQPQYCIQSLPIRLRCCSAVGQIHGGNDCHSVNLLSCCFYPPWYWPQLFNSKFRLAHPATFLQKFGMGRPLMYFCPPTAPILRHWSRRERQTREQHSTLAAN